jgi:hypothetical protein
MEVGWEIIVLGAFSVVSNTRICWVFKLLNIFKKLFIYLSILI